MTQSLLEVRGVETFYGKIQALKGVDLDLYRGPMREEVRVTLGK